MEQLETDAHPRRIHSPVARAIPDQCNQMSTVCLLYMIGQIRLCRVAPDCCPFVEVESWCVALSQPVNRLCQSLSQSFFLDLVQAVLQRLERKYQCVALG